MIETCDFCGKKYTPEVDRHEVLAAIAKSHPHIDVMTIRCCCPTCEPEIKKNPRYRKSLDGIMQECSDQKLDNYKTLLSTIIVTMKAMGMDNTGDYYNLVSYMLYCALDGKNEEVVESVLEQLKQAVTKNITYQQHED